MHLAPIRSTSRSSAAQRVGSSGGTSGSIRQTPLPSRRRRNPPVASTRRASRSSATGRARSGDLTPPAYGRLRPGVEGEVQQEDHQQGRDHSRDELEPSRGKWIVKKERGGLGSPCPARRPRRWGRSPRRPRSASRGRSRRGKRLLL